MMVRNRNGFGSVMLALGAGFCGFLGTPGTAAAQEQGGSVLAPVTVQPPVKRQAAPRRQSASASRAAPIRTRIRHPVRVRPSAAAPSASSAESGTGHVQGYVAQTSATGTKTSTSVLENPQSVSVVTQNQINAQGARSVAEALRYEVGVVSETRVGDRFDNVFIRGYGGFGGNANYLHFWDDLRLPKGVSYAMPSVDPYLLDRIEIARGPDSVLYGQNNPGGLVNLVSKNPTAVPYHEIFTRFGNHNRIEGGFDFSGPVDPSGTLLYRLIGLGRSADTDVNYQTTERYLIAPSVTWRPDNDTRLTIRSSYDHDPSSYQPNWLPALGTLQPNPNGQIPRDFFAGNPYYNRYDRQQTTFGYEFEHNVNDTWTVRQNFRYMDVNSDFKALSATGFVNGTAATCGVGTPANLCLARTSTHYVESLDAIALDNQAQAKFATGWLQHTLLMGVDYQKSWADATYGNGAATYVNYLNPVYTPIAAPAFSARTDQDRQQVGIYGQDQIRFGRLNIALGVRNDWADATSTTRTFSTGKTSTTSPSDSAFTWRAGASYLLDGGFAPYVSYSTSFDPTVGNDYTGAAFKPTTGEQYEVGIKYQPTNVNAIFMLSYYDLMQRNVLTTDSAHLGSLNPLCTASGPYCQMQLGGVHSKGIELSAKASLTDGLDVIASYAHTDMVTTDGIAVSGGQQVSLRGKVPVGVPANTAALWLDYTFHGGRLDGFGFGGGVRYIGSSYGDNINQNVMVVPAYTLTDLAVHYDLVGLSPQFKGWKVALNVTNLFDKYYVSACASSTQCFVGNGRATIGTVRYQW